LFLPEIKKQNIGERRYFISGKKQSTGERRYFNSGKKQSTGERRYFISGKNKVQEREDTLSQVKKQS
jgi:hypothetical protein